MLLNGSDPPRRAIGPSIVDGLLLGDPTNALPASEHPATRSFDQTPRTVAAVITLLSDGLDAIEENSAKAITCFRRAHALMNLQRESSAPTPKDSSPRGLAPWQVCKALAFIEANIMEQITVFDMSPSVRLSPRYFARAFKRSLGETVHDYIYRRRLEQAQELMLTTDEPLSQIAVCCGFSDQAHFTRRFRQSTGETPHAWRRAHFGYCRSTA